jgi:hypothetical protein
MFLKALFKHPKVMELFDYKDKPNELDLAVAELKKFRKDDKVKLNAALDLFKTATESVDKLSGKVKSIDKVIDKFDDKLQQIGKIAHPPAIPLKEINEFRETNKNVKWIMSMFKLMKKNPLLKSMFK